MENSTQTQMPPIWPDLFGSDARGPHLVGGRCNSCGATTLQVRTYCPSCWQTETMVATPIGREGTLYTYTVLHQVPAGFAVPIAVGYVDLPEGVRVFAHLDQSPETLRPGAKLCLSIKPIKTDEKGTAQYGPSYGAPR